MKEFVGCGLVCIAFVLLRFVQPHPTKIHDHLSPTLRQLLYYCEMVSYWGLLIAGLILSFLSDMKLGLITLGCFLWIYKNSLIHSGPSCIAPNWEFAALYGIPLLANQIAGVVGLISLLLGQILLFIASPKWGFISVGLIFLIVQSVNQLTRIEWKLISKNVSEDEKPKDE